MSARERIVRIALAQIECHPAAYISYGMPLEEPFIDDILSLTRLGTHGFPIGDLQQTCLDQYLDWHRTRLAFILRFLMALDHPPDVIVFPEYSVPWQCLQDLHANLPAPGPALFAGTHTFCSLPEANRVYKCLGIEDARIRRYGRVAATAVLPVLTVERAKLIAKTSRSPTEQTEIYPVRHTIPKLGPIRIESQCGALLFLPLICSEALQSYNVDSRYDLVVILSHEDKPQHFASRVDLEIRNHHPVVYCNDGRYGGSGIFTVGDARSNDWQRNIVPFLPAGQDAYLVMDVNLSATAVQVATMAPQKPSGLVGLGSVIYGDMVSASWVAESLTEVRAVADPTARAARLAEILASGKTVGLQATRIEYLLQLAKRGHDASDIWNAIGQDCIVPGMSLCTLEASLANYCQTQLQRTLSIPGGMEEQAAAALVKYLAKCQDVIKRQLGAIQPISAVVPARAAAGIVDRDSEAATILAFLDHGLERLCQVLGREQIGKSTVLEKALAQASITPAACRVVRLTESSSAEYLLASVVFGHEHVASVQAFDLPSLLSKLPSAVNRYRLIVLEDAHTVLRGESFRSAEIDEAVRKLAESTLGTECKLIVLSRRALPDDLLEPSRCRRIWIQGFEGNRLVHGVLYLDTQLRRVGISPNAVDEASKQEVIKTLGGHPVMLALAADKMYQDGVSETLRQIQGHDEFWKAYVARLVKSLELTEDDALVLRVLNGFRMPVAREMIQQCIPIALLSVMRKLIALCLVDVLPDGRVWLSRLLAVHWPFQGLSAEQQQCLHEKAAAWYGSQARTGRDLESVVEAEYHARLADIDLPATSGLVDGHISSAKTLFEQQEYRRAKQVIDQVLQLKRSRDVLRLSALIDSRCNEFEGALRKAREVLNEDPGDARFLQQIAKAALDVDRTDIVSSLVGIARAASMEDYGIALVDGRMLLRQRRFPEAIRAFESARDLTRYDAWPFFYLGRTHLRMGDLTAAADALEDGLAFYDQNHCRNPRVLQALRGLLAQCYLFHGEDEAAETLVALVEGQGESNPEMARARAMLSLKKEGIEQANEAYRRLKQIGVARRDDRCQFHLYYGDFLQRIGDLLGASEQFSRAHDAVSTNVYVLIRLADVLFELADRATREGAWASEEGPALAYARRCAAAVRKILNLAPRIPRAISLQQELFHRFKIQA